MGSNHYTTVTMVSVNNVAQGVTMGPNFSEYGHHRFKVYYLSTGSNSRIVGWTIYPVPVVCGSLLQTLKYILTRGNTGVRGIEYGDHFDVEHHVLVHYCPQGSKLAGFDSRPTVGIPRTTTTRTTLRS